MRLNLIFLFIILIFIAGCIPTTTRDIVGISADMQFISPKTNVVSENEEVQVILSVINFNDFDLNGRVCISDDVKNWEHGGIVGGGEREQLCSYIYLDAYDREINKYDKSIENFGTFAYTNLREDFNIYAEVFYPVSLNIVVDNFCIQRPLYELLEEKDIKEKKVCDNEEMIIGSNLKGNSAPLTVTSIKKTLKPGSTIDIVRVELEIYLDKIDGVIVGPDGLEMLDPYFNFYVTYGGKNFLCRLKDTNIDVNYGFSDKLKLKQKAKEILSCSALLPAGSEPEFGSLDIYMNYYFKQIISKKLEVKRMVSSWEEMYWDVGYGGEI